MWSYVPTTHKVEFKWLVDPFFHYATYNPIIVMHFNELPTLSLPLITTIHLLKT